MNDWRPIETAPKDGTAILLFGGEMCDDTGPEHIHPSQAVARWVSYQVYEGGGAWFVATADAGAIGITFHKPTHWMKLPDPPETAP